jgi:predicted Fe-Mo cluster-binding NifX family protein
MLATFDLLSLLTARQLRDVAVMKVAIPHWQDRVSPVFDAATRLVLIEMADGRECGRADWTLVATDPAQRAGELSRSGTDVLICGAISRPLEMAVTSEGIQVIAQVCGKVEEVLKAFAEDRLSDPVFLMPGCRGQRRRSRGRHGRGHARENSDLTGTPRDQHGGGKFRGPVT